MRNYLLILLSFFVVFAYSCSGSDDNENNNVECKEDKDCKEGEVCNTIENKCEVPKQENVLTSIEVDIEDSSNAKSADLLVSERKTVRAYGIYDNNEAKAEDISLKVRWYSSNSSVGIAKKDNGQIKFEAKNVGTTEIYCKYRGIESEHVVFNVLEANVSEITLKSNIGNSIYLHQSLVWDIIATFDGGKQGKLDEDSVEFHSEPEGLIRTENGEYKFSAPGNYEVWVTKDDIESNRVSMEVLDNIVTGLELTYNRDDGDFYVNTPHSYIVKELYKGDGESVLTSADNLEWTCETRTDNGDGTYTPNECQEGDYEVNGFMITFKRVETFYMTVSKTYSENCECDDNKCIGAFTFVVNESNK